MDKKNIDVSGIIEQLQREFGNSIAQKKNLDKETAKNRTKGDPKPLIFQNGNELYALSWEELKKVIEKIQTDGKWDKGTELIHSERKNYFADYQMKTEEDIENFLKREMGGTTMKSVEDTSISIEDEIKDLIKNGATQIILTGAPGTGKTRMVKEIAEEQGAELTWEEKKEKDDSCPHYKLVQFHPSYDYTDFVEGLRPVEEGGEMVFRKVDGIFKEFCRKVVEEGEQDEKYFFLIDEINRADLSKVFGELMFCLETDKRGEDNAIQTQYQNLPTYDTKEKKYYGEDESEDVFKDGFYIPKNVIIIGTMNDIDRSVESMDFALRRRFIWKEIVVNKAMLEASLTDIIKIENPEGIAVELAKRINDLNENQLKEKLGKHYYISQGQFANLPKNIIDDAVKAGNAAGENKVEAIAKSLLEAVWKLRLESLLYEYIRGEGNEDEFVKACKVALDSKEQSKDKN